MLIVLISVIVALLYHKITEYVNNRKIDSNQWSKFTIKFFKKITD
ncbi:Membrane protein [Streptococcus pneumoniae]|nr:Membrane protein [Streptococcus pneumoniae]